MTKGRFFFICLLGSCNYKVEHDEAYECSALGIRRANVSDITDSVGKQTFRHCIFAALVTAFDVTLGHHLTAS
jgi:hypothetical protein